MRVIALIVASFVLTLAGCASDDAGRPTVTALSSDDARHRFPAYAPDGKRLAWWAPGTDSSGSWQLWVGNFDLSGAVKLPVTGGPNPLIWSPDGTRIAATSNRFGLSHSVVIPVGGGDAIRVSAGSGIDQPLTWYSDGDRLAYFASAEGGTFNSFVFSTRTGLSRPSVPGERRPHVAFPSPDGSRVAYSIFEGTQATIWIADSAGSNRRQLTTEGFESFPYPSGPWSPDGKEILYTSRRTGTMDLWVVPVDGGQPRQLTRDVRNDRNPTWSGDGKWVAFISDRGKQIDVWVVPAAGGVERRITDDAVEEEAGLRWRPGTNELTFVANRITSGVWAVNLADGQERRLTPDSIRTGWFNVSPDGKQINYVIIRGGGIHDLAVMPLAGGPSRILVAGGGTVLEAQWSPDGSKIVFQSDRSGTADVWLVDAAGGAPRPLVAWPGSDHSPVWNSDGSSVFFISDRDSRLGDVWKVPASGGEPTRVTTDGSVGEVTTRPGVAHALAETISPREGKLTVLRISAEGKLSVIWDRSNAYARAFSPSGDSLTAQVEQPDGTLRAMILSASGSGGRVVLKAGETIANWSNDGQWILYQMSVGGASDLGVLRVSDGTTRRLTTTPENEGGSEFAPDGKTVVFSRTRVVQRIYTADLSTLLSGGKKP